MPLNFEFKAKTNKAEEQEEKLKTLDFRFLGEDIQTDTYFHVNNGRMKLREGRIENFLIHYKRENAAGSKLSTVLLYKTSPETKLKEILIAALGIKIIVEKTRRIYYVGNVKIHFDNLPSLGSFIEVEAIDTDGTHSIEYLKEQCSWFADFFGVNQVDYESLSYSDLLLDQ